MVFFSQANLKDADLSWAILDTADLTGVDLTGADISHTNLMGVTYDGTTMPDGSAKTETPENYERLGNVDEGNVTREHRQIYQKDSCCYSETLE